VRIGSAGAISEELNLGDLVMCIGACTDSNYAASYGLPGVFAPTASCPLAQKAWQSAQKLSVKLTAGNLLSTDVFYGDDGNAMRLWQKMGVLAVEMEAAALYMNAARAGKSALCICTISDTIFTGQALPAKARENSFTQMIEVALGMLETGD